MLNRDLVANRLEEIVTPILEELGLELVDIEFGTEGRRRVVRFIIDSPRGVTIDDCGKVTHRISDILDADENIIPGSYNLEVSSPGFDRHFKTPKDFVRNIGKRVKAVTRVPMNGQNVFIGLLESYHPDSDKQGGFILLKEKEEIPAFHIALEDLAVVHLDIDWESILGSKSRNKGRKTRL